MHELNGGSCDATIKVKYMPEVQSIAYPLSSLSLTTREIEETSEEDEDFVELRVCINNGDWKGDKLKHFCKRRAVRYREADPKSP